jgi:hypothetical protein
VHIFVEMLNDEGIYFVVLDDMLDPRICMIFLMDEMIRMTFMP